jgi:hypothetical protein
MGDIGNYSSKLDTNSQSLREFDKALRSLKRKKEINRIEETQAIEKLLNVVRPVAESIEGNLTEFTLINELSIVRIMKNRHDRDWQQYKEGIHELELKLESERFTLSQNDFRLLNDIADALDAECANLFRRMSGRI